MPPPVNEAALGYLPGSPEKLELKAKLATMAGEKVDIPIVIGGQEIRTGRTHAAVMPHNQDRKSTRLNSSHVSESRMPSSA